MSVFCRRKVARPMSLDKQDMAHYVSAYTYGNFLILAALMTLDEHSILSGAGAVTVLATGVCTFIAHVVAESQENRVLAGGTPTKEVIVHGLKNALPILTTTIFPVIILWLAMGTKHDLYDELAADITMVVCVLTVIIRIFMLGFRIAKFRGTAVTFRSFFRTLSSSLVLTGVVIAVAAAKVLLTHH